MYGKAADPKCGRALNSLVSLLASTIYIYIHTLHCTLCVAPSVGWLVCIFLDGWKRDCRFGLDLGLDQSRSEVFFVWFSLVWFGGEKKGGREAANQSGSGPSAGAHSRDR